MTRFGAGIGDLLNSSDCGRNEVGYTSHLEKNVKLQITLSIYIINAPLPHLSPVIERRGSNISSLLQVLDFPSSPFMACCLPHLYPSLKLFPSPPPPPFCVNLEEEPRSGFSDLGSLFHLLCFLLFSSSSLRLGLGT